MAAGYVFFCILLSVFAVFLAALAVGAWEARESFCSVVLWILAWVVLVAVLSSTPPNH